MRVIVYSEREEIRNEFATLVAKNGYGLGYTCVEQYDQLQLQLENLTGTGLCVIDVEDSRKKELYQLTEALHKRNPECRVVFVMERKPKEVERLYLYEHNIAGVLFKPVDQEHAGHLIERLIQRFAKKQERTRKKKQTQLIEVKDNRQFYQLLCADIFYLEGQNHNVNLHLYDHTIRTNKKLYMYEQELPEFFIRCHKGYIVNLKKVESYSRQEIILCNEQRVPMGRNYYDMFRKTYEIGS